MVPDPHHQKLVIYFNLLCISIAAYLLTSTNEKHSNWLHLCVLLSSIFHCVCGRPSHKGLPSLTDSRLSFCAYLNYEMTTKHKHQMLLYVLEGSTVNFDRLKQEIDRIDFGVRCRYKNVDCIYYKFLGEDHFFVRNVGSTLR